MPPVRLVGSVVLSLLTRAASGYWHLFDSQCGYTVASRRALAAIGPERCSRATATRTICWRAWRGGRARGRRAGAAGLRPGLAFGAASARAWRCRLLCAARARAFARRMRARLAPVTSRCSAWRPAQLAEDRPPHHVVSAPRRRLRRQLRRRSRAAPARRRARSRCWRRRRRTATRRRVEMEDAVARSRSASRSPPARLPSGNGSLFYGGAPRGARAAAAPVWLAAAQFSGGARARRRGGRARALGRRRIALAGPERAGGAAAAPSPPADAPSPTRATWRCSSASRSGARMPAGLAARDATCDSSATRCRRGSPSRRPIRSATVEPLALPPASSARAGGSRRRARRRQLGLRAPTVLAVGPAGADQGPRDAAARLRPGPRDRRPSPRWRSSSSATGRNAPACGRLAAALGVRLRLPGFVRRDEVARWLRAARRVRAAVGRLANGRTEGAPVATAEARAVGIPVVIEKSTVIAPGARPFAPSSSSTRVTEIRTSTNLAAKPASQHGSTLARLSHLKCQ